MHRSGGITLERWLCQMKAVARLLGEKLQATERHSFQVDMMVLNMTILVAMAKNQRGWGIRWVTW